MEKKIKVAFLDRDGVINKDIGYLSNYEQFEYIEGSIDAMKILEEEGYRIIIITNQSGIARGFFSLREYEILTNQYLTYLKNFGIIVLDVFYCPHHADGIRSPYNINCDCRKPKPGMILKAIKKYNICLNSSFLVGDKYSDIKAAKFAGIEKTYLVKSKYLDKDKISETIVFENLLSSVLDHLNFK